MPNLVELGLIFHPLMHIFPVRLILSGVLLTARVIWHTSSLHTNVFESILRQHTGDLKLVTHQMTHFRRPSHHFSSYFMQADRATITPNRRPSHHFSFNQNRKCYHHYKQATITPNRLPSHQTGDHHTKQATITPFFIEIHA